MRCPELNPHSATFRQIRCERDIKPELKDLSANQLIDAYRVNTDSQTHGNNFAETFRDMNLTTNATQIVAEMGRRIDGSPAFDSSPFVPFLPPGTIKKNHS